MREVKEKWDLFRGELKMILFNARIAAIGKHGEELLAIHRAMNKELSERIFHQDRALAALAGEHVEPIAHEASATLFPAAGLSE